MRMRGISQLEKGSPFSHKINLISCKTLSFWRTNKKSVIGETERNRSCFGSVNTPALGRDIGIHELMASSANSLEELKKI